MLNLRKVAAGALAAASLGTPAFASVVSLDFSRGAFNGTSEVITFDDILGIGSGTDLLVTPIGGAAAFNSFNTANNGTVNGFGSINLAVTAATNSTDFRFAFVDAFGSPADLMGGNVILGISDLDFGRREAVTFLSPVALTVSADTDLLLDTDPVGGNPRLRGTVTSNVTNPSAAGVDLTAEQERAAVNANFGNVNVFDMRLSVLSGSTSSGRNFFLSGSLVFDDTVPEVVVDTLPPPAPVPLPASLALLLSGVVGLSFFARRRT